MRVLELFAGIGGCAAALHPRDEVLAVEQSPVAQRVYEARHGRRPAPWNLALTPAARWAAWGAELWWMSPPCQPYTTGARPAFVALENVPGFVTSRARGALQDALTGYEVQEHLLCPTDLGVPMRRLRYYLVAARGGGLGEGARDVAGALARAQARLRGEVVPTPALARPLASYLDRARDLDPDLRVPDEIEARYPGALTALSPEDPAAVATCFTAAYGRSWVRSGAYLRTQAGLRLFAPEEVARLMGFGPGPLFPAEVPRAKRWALIGNSLSVDAVRAVLSRVPGYALGTRDLMPGTPEPGGYSASSGSPGST